MASNADLVRALENLNRNLGGLSRDVRESAKATSDANREAKRGGGLRGAAGLAMRFGSAVAGGAIGQAALNSLQNEHTSFSRSITDMAVRGAARFGADSTAIAGTNIGEERTADFAARLARGGREVPLERLRRRLELESERAEREVDARKRVEGLASERRVQIAGEGAAGAALESAMLKFEAAIDKMLGFFSRGG